MKLTPRRAENAVAKLLSEHFAILHMAPVERIPVIGRRGPDISINQSNLVIDVKSRKEVPMMVATVPPNTVVQYDNGFVGVQIESFPMLYERQTPDLVIHKSSKAVQDWWTHMDEWTKENKPDGFSCLALRRPKMPHGKTLVVISQNDWRHFYEHIQRYRTNNEHSDNGQPK